MEPNPPSEVRKEDPLKNLILGWMANDWQGGQDILDRVVPFAMPIHCRKDETLLDKGDRSDLLYFVQKGTVEVSNTVEDTKIVMAIIGEGNFFGEIGFFDRQPRTCDVTAMEASDIYAFDEGSLQRIRDADPKLYGDFLCLVTQIISRRFRGLLEEQEPITAYAAALTRGRRFDVSTPLPAQFFHSSEWRTVNRYVERFKARLYDLSYHLQEGKDGAVPEDAVKSCFSMIDAFSGHLEEIQGWRMPDNTAAYIWGYVFKEVFPYLMRSRFAERAYYKPQGYAGDYFMMEMIYRDRPEGDGKLGLLVDRWMLGSVPSDAVRGRRRLLTEALETLCTERVAGSSAPIKIMSLACGPAREFCDFIGRFPASEAVEALLVDIDPEALQYAAANVNRTPNRAVIRFMRENLIRWALGRVRHHFEPQDVIYSAGLTDYLGRPLFTALVRQCYHHLKPGGTLIVGNFGPANPHRAFMDHLLKWELIHRSESDLVAIFDDTPFRDGHVEVVSERHGVNLFVRAFKNG